MRLRTPFLYTTMPVETALVAESEREGTTNNNCMLQKYKLLPKSNGFPFKKHLG